MSGTVIVLVAVVLVAVVLYDICVSVFFSPLAKIPGPKSFALTRFRLAYEDYKGTRTRKINSLHKEYGSAVRVGPNEVTFNSTTALRTIYGAGSGFERTRFYKMFEAYGRKNMFSFSSVREHGERKKLFAHAYAKSAIMKGETAAMIEAKTRLFLEFLEREGRTSEIFTSLHYFSLDNITQFLYGGFGKTSCLEGAEKDRALLGDILDQARRQLSWYTVHFPAFTKWLYSRTGLLGCIARRFYPMKLPTTYTCIRRHALKSCQSFCGSSAEEKAVATTLISKLWKHRGAEKGNGMDDLDIASECSDHLLAGIDTTGDSLMFLLWALSRPENKRYQEKVIEEVRSMLEESLNFEGIPKVESCDRLPYLDAVIKETLRLYAPLPGTEPRSSPVPTVVDGYTIPAGTVVSISPYALHRNAEVFKDPMEFKPERWLDSSQDAVAEMKRWFWAFSSGGRMCIGMHLAMAEMTTLVAAIYRKYTTATRKGFDHLSPAVTARYEIFYDESCSDVREHECWVEFIPQS